MKVQGLQLVNGIYRSRKVLPPDVAAILGKKELTKSTGIAGQKGDMVALAKAHEVAIREDHASEFIRIIKVSSKHLGRYVDEFTFRLNEGNVARHTTERLDSFVDGAAGKRLTYKDLIG